MTYPDGTVHQQAGSRATPARPYADPHEPGARSHPRPAGAAVPRQPAGPGPARGDHARLRAAAQHGVPPDQRDDRRGLRRPPRRRAPVRPRASRRSRSGSGFSRQEPLQRIARGRLSGAGRPRRDRPPRGAARPRRAVRRGGARPGRPPLVTDVGVRLPAHLTASGRAILAALPPPRCARSTPTGRRSSTGTARAADPSALRTLLAETRQRGYATEDGEVTPGLRQRRRRGARPQRLPGGRDGGHVRRGPRADRLSEP